jgi:hypothetical protein
MTMSSANAMQHLRADPALYCLEADINCGFCDNATRPITCAIVHQLGAAAA